MTKPGYPLTTKVADAGTEADRNMLTTKVARYGYNVRFETRLRNPVSMTRYVMFILTLIFALVSAVPQVAATNNAALNASKDLVVSDFYWGRVTSRTFVNQPMSTSSDPWERPRIRRRFGSAPPAVILQRETYALVRNVGTRTIKFVTWDYVFYADAKHERETQRFQFRSKDTIQPGEMKFLSESVRESAPTVHGDVVIERIEYDDGSSWQRASAK
jgi:hypothetical protein